MTNQHPITPPPDLIEQWQDESLETQIVDHIHYLAICAAQWGADQELDACVKWVEANAPGYFKTHELLRAARRPKPPSLKEQALETLNFMESEAPYDKPMIDTIRRALEALDD